MGEKTKEAGGARPGAAEAVLAAAIILLDSVRIHYRHYFPYQVLDHVLALSEGASPAMVLGLVVLIHALSLAVFLRLLLAAVPSAAGRRRWAAGLAGAPIVLAAGLAFNYVFVNITGAASLRARLPGAAAAALGLAAALALFVVLGLTEGSSKSVRERLILFAKVMGELIVIGPAVIFLRAHSQYLLILPGAGAPACAALNLALGLGPVWLVGFIHGRKTHAAAHVGWPTALAAVALAGLLSGLAVFFPGPAQDLESRPPPRMITRPDVVALDYEDRDSKKIASTDRLRVMVGKAPFSLDLFDHDNQALFRLAGGPEVEDVCQGVAVSRELRAAVEFADAAPGRLGKGRLRLTSSPLLEAEKVERRGETVAAEGRAGPSPAAVWVSFPHREILRVRVEAPDTLLNTISVAFPLGEDERVYGLGGDPSGRGRRGLDLDLLAETRTPAAGEIDWEAGRGRLRLVSGQGEREWAAPLAMLSRGVGVLAAEGEDLRWEVDAACGGAVRLSARGGVLELYVITGSSPAGVWENYAWLTGPRASPPARALLPWVDAGEMELGMVADAVEASGFPPGLARVGADAVPDAAAMRRGMGLGLGFVLEDRAEVLEGGEDFARAVASGWAVKDRAGLPYFRRVRGRRALLIDFTHPDAAGWRAAGWRRMKEAGIQGLALDARALPPPDAILYNGRPGLAMRNLFMQVYAEAAADAMGQDAVIAAGAGGTGLERHAAVLWPPRADPGPDPGPDPEKEIGRMIALGWSGAPITGPAAGPGVAAPLMIVPADEIAARAEPARRQARLFPYWYSVARAAAERGLPAVSAAGNEDDEYPACYFAGPSLLAVPGPAGGGASEADFPAGRWLRLDTLAFFPPGPREVVVPADSPLLFLAEGTLLPVGDDDFVAAGAEMAPVAVMWIAGPPASFELFDGARLAAGGGEGSLFFSVSGGGARTYTLIVYDSPPARGMFANGVRLAESDWSYQERARVLTVPGLLGPDLRLEAVLESGE